MILYTDQWLKHEAGKEIPRESFENLDLVKNDIRQKLEYYK